MTVEFDNLSALFDLTEDSRHQYRMDELQNLIGAVLYLIDSDTELKIDRQEPLDTIITYFRERLKEKNLQIAEILRQSKIIEGASGKAAAHRYLVDELAKINSKFVRRILFGFAQAMA